MRTRIRSILALTLILGSGACEWPGAQEAVPRNVILFVGDGMGPEQVRAASLYSSGIEAGLVFQAFPHGGSLTTRSADSAITDSAAAATAIATGVKVNNGVISVRLPGDGSPLLTLLEHYESMGKASGIVSTKHLSDATPAAFAAHRASRSMTDAIAADMFAGAGPDLMLGGGGYGISAGLAEANGYAVVVDEAGLAALANPRGASESMRVSGQFGSGPMPYMADGLGDLPSLGSMTRKALELLSADPDGFFLVVEGGLIDTACHANDLMRAVYELLELNEAVKAALERAAGGSDTLILVLADHETGGLIDVSGGIGSVSGKFSTTAHSAVNVPVYAWGAGSRRFSGTMDNSQIPELICGEPLN
ncbi:MAG: alkaline phosphatase [Spirochaetes bacterium]|nr:alkaline phosphatase [Spirochaetota bacterium]MBU1080840.1 alkaline phosphatase [Spirochaetota bacterium]